MAKLIATIALLVIAGCTSSSEDRTCASWCESVGALFGWADRISQGTRCRCSFDIMDLPSLAEIEDDG